MSEQLLIEQLDEAIDAIVAPASSGAITFTADEPVLRELAAVASELRLLPRENFKSSLKETLRRSATMTATGTERQQSSEPLKAGYHTVTPYLTVKRAEQLVEFVKEAFGATEVFRTIGSAGGLHAEVTIGDSKLMIGGYEAVEEIPTALHLYVPDADAVYQRALDSGATSVEEPVDQFYGDREAGVKDPTGNVWWIATHKLGLPGTYIPEGLRPVTPFLHPIGAAGLIEFMKQAFAAEEISREQSPEGMIHHALVRVGDSMIEMGEAHGAAQPMPPALFVNVENLEEAYARALSAGATSLQPPVTQGYGRTAWVKDAWDNIWYLTAPAETRKGEKGKRGRG
ncbi:MAG TPA: VOC family protein [Pyrinomonadaceae bacterium]|nr:VOC family protein [Pyrinomonadaceae bacterium]